MTMFFIFPNNPLNITLMCEKQIFETNFFQRWSFFAPPPNFNERVYIILKDQKSNQKNIYEIIEPILNLKSAKVPFNGQEQIYDYILSSTITNIEQNLRSFQEIFNSANQNKKIITADSINTENLVFEIEKTEEFKTLTNYAKKVAFDNQLDIKKISYQIQIVKNSIPQFIDRRDKTQKSQVIFSSHFLNF